MEGLTSAQAAARLRQDGPNELPRSQRRPFWRIVLEVLREPMLLLLLVGGLAYLLLGDLTEALLLLIFATLSVVITTIQEGRTEHVLAALRDLSAPHAIVIRNGRRQPIAARDVVRGDLLVLEQGDLVAADALLVEASDVQADESLLTGESLPVAKAASAQDPAPSPQHPDDEEPCRVYSGSLIVRGSGVAWVVATGSHSAIGRIGQSLATLDIEASRLRRETTRIVTWCAFGGGLVALLVILLYGLLRGGWIEAVLAGIAVGMAMLPEEFPVVLTVFLAMGAWRIGHAGVLTRRAAAIEALGSITVLCTDKTGTLTENHMALAELWLPTGESHQIGRNIVPDARQRNLIEIAALASAVEPIDPMEIALQDARRLSSPASQPPGELVHAYPLRPDLLAMSNVWDDGTTVRICAKGAPEAIAGLCRLPADTQARLLAATDAMARRGIRVLAVATAVPQGRTWAASQLDYTYDLTGLVGLADPLRASVPGAIAECHRAGIRVVMITGDHAATAQTIATQAGIAAGDVLTGPELQALDDAALAHRIRTVTVCARIMPEQKLRLVQAYKAQGEVVAMTGDGVNDAPSLKAAHVGVAMGKRGTDVAREAAAIVLLNDDFSAIVRTIRLGRRIYDNIRKAMAFIFAAHIPIAGLALLPLFLGLPILMGPIHIALLEMVIDPACALAFEAQREERDLMQRPPRDPAQPMFSIPMLVWSFFQGGLALVLLALILFNGIRLDMPEPELRALVFFSLVAEIVALILANRSYRAPTGWLRKSRGRGQARNTALWLILAAVVGVTLFILWLPPLQAVLKFGSIHWSDMALAVAAGAGLLACLEFSKRFMRRFVIGGRA